MKRGSGDVLCCVHTVQGSFPQLAELSLLWPPLLKVFFFPQMESASHSCKAPCRLGKEGASASLCLQKLVSLSSLCAAVNSKC